MTKIIRQTTVKGLLRKNGKILLVKDPKGIWELPGGRIQHNEKPEEALRRELREELGWAEANVKNIVDTWRFSSTVRGVPHDYTVLIYYCTTDQKSIVKNDEHDEYRWTSISEVKNLNMRDGYKKSIKNFIKKIGNPKVPGV